MAEVIDLNQEYEDGVKDLDDEPSTNSSKKQKLARKSSDQKYRYELERESDFRGWLERGKLQNNQISAYIAHCLFCKKDFLCKKGKYDLKRHKQSKVHEVNEKVWIDSRSKTMPLDHHFCSNSRSKRVATVEAKLVSFPVENDLLYSLSDNLLKLMKSIPGPDLLSHASLGRTKATNIA
jgi:hypothetical protein